MQFKFWSLCSRTTLYSCKGHNRWQSAHELMSSQAREISALKKMCKFVYFGCSSYFGFNATLVAVVFSCYVGLSPHLDKNQDYFNKLKKRIPIQKRTEALSWMQCIKQRPSFTNPVKMVAHEIRIPLKLKLFGATVHGMDKLFLSHWTGQVWLWFIHRGFTACATWIWTRKWSFASNFISPTRQRIRPEK